MKTNHRRERLAQEEALVGFKQFKCGKSLQEILRVDLQLDPWLPTFELLAPLLQPKTPEERSIDKEIEQGISFASSSPSEFIQCRQLFHQQRALVLEIAHMEASSDKHDTLDSFLDHVKSHCCGFYFRPHRELVARCFTGQEHKKFRPSNREEKEEEDKSWFLACLEMPLLRRDLKIGFDAVFSEGRITQELLQQAYAQIGESPNPIMAFLEEETFQEVFDLICNNQ